MLRIGSYTTVSEVGAEVTELTTVNHLNRKGMGQYASMVRGAVISMLINENPDIDDDVLNTTSLFRVLALGRINSIWKEPVWDWRTGKLISANTGGNWELHNNFNISPDSEPMCILGK